MRVPSGSLVSKPRLVTALPFLLALAALAAPTAAQEREKRYRDDPRARAEWNAMWRRDAQGQISSERRLQALRHACTLPIDPSMPQDPAGSFSRSDAGPSVRSALTFSGTTWQSLGPRPALSLPLDREGIAFGSVSGRITALAIHPTNPSILLLGGATGGIWKSTDGGANWRPVADTAPALATSGIAFSSSNPSIVYAATGEADSAYLEYEPSASLGTYLGAGLLKSVDAGETWTRIDLNLPANSVLSRVLVHPSDPQLVVVGVYLVGNVAANACAPGGAWRSTDGGVHFSRTFPNAVSDLVQDPNIPDTVYGAFGVTQITGPTACPVPADPSGIYRSTDFGSTWLPSLVPSTNGATFTSPTGNIRLGISRTSPAVLYASILDSDNTHEKAGIFRSSDAGATWTKRSTDPNMCSDPIVAQCFYDHYVTVSPSSSDVLYFGGINIFKSTDGAATWKALFDVYRTGGTVHVDQHAALIVPTAPNTVYFANDGGLYRTTDGGQSFQNLNDSLTLAQFNGVALGPADPNFMMGGTQDNGNLRFKNSLLWTDRTSGDGGFNLIRQDSPSVILNAHFYAAMEYSGDGGDSFNDVTPAQLLDSTGPREPMAFYPPAAAAPLSPGTVFFGTQRVWSNSSFGSSPGGWVPRSAPMWTTGVITALDVVGDGSGPMWIGSSNGDVLFSMDGGVTFTKRNAGLPASPAFIVSKIRSVSGDGRSAIMTLGGFSGLPARHVFRTNDAGATWTNISGNLPDAPASALAIDPTDPNDLFVGTDVGVFRSTNGGASWSSYNQGLPNVPVTDLRFHPVSGDLVASTYGRGVYRIPGPGGGSGTFVPGANFTFSIDPPAVGQSVLFTDHSSGPPTSWLWDFGDASPTSTQQNPVHTYARPGIFTVTLTVANAAGSSRTTRKVVVTSGVVSPVVLQVPVVLDVFGVPPTHFTSDLVIVNRSAASSRLSILYTPAPGTPGAGGLKIADIVGEGRELRISDVVQYLRTNGYTIPASGPNIVGTLRITFEDVSDPSLVFAGSRISTPNPNASVGGSFGLFMTAVLPSTAPVTTTTVIGLREDTTARSNLAFVNLTDPSGAESFTVQLIDGDSGFPAGVTQSFTLQPGEWRQLNSVLGNAKNGWAKISKGASAIRFLTYGVLNDGSASGGGTSDGSFLGADASAGLVPVVVHATAGSTIFSTELVLTNTTPVAVNVVLTYTPATLFTPGPPATATISLGPYRQLRIPDTIRYLRDTLGLPLAPGDGSQGGTLNVSGALAYARTFNPNPDTTVGGTFGLAYPAVPTAARAKTEAWVYGLLQNADTRSNLAIADARLGDPTSVPYLVEIYDSINGDGSAPRTTRSISLAGGQWFQFTKVLDGTGLTNAYVRVRPQTGTSDFIVYGVLNDGANPGERTSDGSYVPMSGVK